LRRKRWKSSVWRKTKKKRDLEMVTWNERRLINKTNG
jgi:hypothetical protein